MLCCLVLFFRVFANETSQFLAPYDTSVRPQSGETTPPDNITDCKTGIGTSVSHVRIVSGIMHNFFVYFFFDFNFKKQKKNKFYFLNEFFCSLFA